MEEQTKFVADVEKIGATALAKLEKDGSRGVVLLGRSYNVCDLGANLNLPQKIRDLGLLAFTVDMLPLSHIRIALFKNMYWKYGRKMLQAATLGKARWSSRRIHDQSQLRSGFILAIVRGKDHARKADADAGDG